MKTIYDFIYCNSVLTSRTVFYRVRVGTSDREQRAKQFLIRLARSPDYFFCKHSLQSMHFIEKCAISIYKGIDILHAIKLIRCVTIDVTDLVSLIRNAPHALVNGLKVKAIENPIKVLPQSVNVKNLSKQCKQQTTKRSSQTQS